VAVRPRFDPSREFVAARGFTFAGTTHGSGDPFDKAAATPSRLAMLYESRMINFAPEDTKPADPVQVVQVSGGYYNVSAPWLDEPIRARGKAKMEEAAAQLRADGPPLGWIAGGTQTTVSGGEGGWYEVTAPWLDEPEKVQGREAAEARQRELHAAGEPDSHHGVTLTAGDNGWFEVKADWADEAEKVHGEEAARDRAAELRAEGAPAEIEPVEGPAGQVLVTQENDEVWMVTAPWLDEPHRFTSVEAAEADQAAVREAGPPEGWEAPAAPPAEPPAEAPTE
jgi:hypothetical protein